MNNNSYIYLVAISQIQNKGWAPGVWEDPTGRLSILGAIEVAIWGKLGLVSPDPFEPAPEGVDPKAWDEINQLWGEVYGEVMEFSHWALEDWETTDGRTQDEVLAFFEALILSTQLRELGSTQDDNLLL